MADVERAIRLIFSASDRATAPINRIVQAVTGIGSAATRSGLGFAGLVRTIHHIGGAARTIAAGARMAVGPIRQVLGAAQEMQETTLAMAGVLKAYDVAPTFEEALKTSKELYKSIRKEAAALPGEASDYIEVFRTALPAALSVGMKNVEKISKMTSRFAAVTATLGIDPGQAGSNLMMILQGRAGTDVDSFTQLKALMGDIAKDTDTFNKALPVERIQAIERALESYTPLLGEFDQTISATGGALKSQLEDMKIAIGEPILQRMIAGTSELNGWIDKNRAAVDRVADAIGTGIVRGIDMAIAGFRRLANVASGFGDKLKLPGAGAAMGRAFENVKGAVGAGGAEGGVGGIVGAFSPALGVAIAAVQQFATHTDAISRIVETAARVFESVTSILEPLVQFIATIGATLGNLAANVLPPILDALADVWNVISNVIGSVLRTITETVEELKPWLERMGQALGKMVDAVRNILEPILRSLGGVFSWLFDKFIVVLKPAALFFILTIENLAKAIAATIDFIHDLVRNREEVSSVLQHFGSRAPQPVVDTPAVAAAVAEGVEAGVKAAEDVDKGARGAAARKGRGGKAQNNYDFRNSRFSIEQRFAEGFDPDRIAVVMANGFADLAERRVQSSFAPLFAVQ